jgi:hypothetical protein
MWWSHEEVECMISKATYSADESRKNKVLVDALDQALRDARRSALLFNSNINDSLVKVLNDETLLYLWCHYGHSRRGLEKMVSRVHQTTRDNIVRKARSNVIALSRSGATPEVVQAAYEKASQSSVIFANMIAAADAQAALHPVAERRRSMTQMLKETQQSSFTTTVIGRKQSPLNSPQTSCRRIHLTC